MSYGKEKPSRDSGEPHSARTGSSERVSFLGTGFHPPCLNEDSNLDQPQDYYYYQSLYGARRSFRRCQAESLPHHQQYCPLPEPGAACRPHWLQFFSDWLKWWSHRGASLRRIVRQFVQENPIRSNRKRIKDDDLFRYKREPRPPIQ